MKTVKNLIAKSLIVALTMSVASAALAKAPEPKPTGKCPMGQVWVKKNGIWQCQALGIKSQSSEQRGAAASSKRATPTKPTPIKKYQAKTPKPDMIIYSIEKSNTDDKKMVIHVQNIGKVKSQGGKVKVKLNSGASSSASMPDVKPNEIRLVYVNFRTDIKKGTRATATADSTKVIKESNEGNNVKHQTL